MFYKSPRDGQTYQLQLIDTPGHVDFTYEVSRSLAACEGALLVVDASQGVEAQTVANTYLAVESGLELIPCLNKVDLPGAEPERVAEEVADLLGEPADTMLRISAKTGEGVTISTDSIDLAKLDLTRKLSQTDLTGIEILVEIDSIWTKTMFLAGVTGSMILSFLVRVIDLTVLIFFTESSMG